MQKFHIFFLLISPSPFSMVATFISALLFVTYVNWAYISNNPLVYRTILGPEGFSTYVWENTSSISEWMSQFFSSTIGYYVSLGVIAVIVGIAVYTLLQIVTFAITGTAHYFQRAELASSPVGLMEIFMQLWVRSLALIGIVFFSAALTGTIIPMIETLIDTGANLIGAFQIVGLIQYGIGFLLTAISLHMFVVFVRILILRPRVFNNSQIY